MQSESFGSFCENLLILGATMGLLEKMSIVLGVIFAITFLLAFVGKIPLNYNIRNLVVRWPITLMTAMAFTLVVGVLLVMLAFVNGMYKLTESSGH